MRLGAIWWFVSDLHLDPDGADPRGTGGALADFIDAVVLDSPVPERHLVLLGDTFQLTSGERIRIAGIDAAETQLRQAKCRAEIATGKQQTADARRLIEGRIVGLVRVGRSYNRTVARASLEGRDVAAALVGIGAARWRPRDARKPSWCKRAQR